MRDNAPPDRILAVTAHPDDADFGAGGTLARWVAQGAQVSLCVVTDGDAGGFDPAVPRAQIPQIRRTEQRAASAELGITDVRFLGYRDGELAASQPLRRDLSRVIRQVRPQRVLLQSPERNWLRIAASHPDHLAAGEAAMCAVYPDARNPFAHPELLAEEGLQAWVVPEVWVMGHPAPNRYVDVTDTVGRKLAALRAHESQTGHVQDLEGFVRGWMTEVAAEGGLPAGRLAEAFLTATTP